MDDKLDGEWLEALEVDAPADDAPADDKSTKDEDTKDDDGKADDDQKADDDSKEDKDSKGDEDSDADDSKGDDKQLPKDDKKPEEKEAEPPKDESTKQAIKEALKEIDDAKTDRTSRVDSLKKEVAETLYPEGIDRQLRDSDGDPITGIDDLTKLINPRTGELFTDEEAGSWLLSAQQKLNQDVETVEKFIEQVAEVNANVTEGANRVAEKYGKILSADDKLRARLIQAYDKTLVKDPKTGVTINNPVDVEEFFDIALGDRYEASITVDAEAEKAAKEKAKKEAKDSQSDRGDLKPSGKSDNLDPEDKEWATAIKEYEEGK